VKRFYDPWVGKDFQRGSGLLILSESAYKWEGGAPRSDHPSTNTVKCWSLDQERWDRPGRSKGVYSRALTRTLCGEMWPDEARRIAAWDRVAYSIYVQRVLSGPSVRPLMSDIAKEKEPFFELLECLQPSRVVITSRSVWTGMPACDVDGENYRGAYRLKSGHLVWCLAVPHPHSRHPRYDWKEVGGQIRGFCQAELRRS
jgi:hypothetical protein